MQEHIHDHWDPWKTKMDHVKCMGEYEMLNTLTNSLKRFPDRLSSNSKNENDRSNKEALRLRRNGANSKTSKRPGTAKVPLEKRRILKINSLKMGDPTVMHDDPLLDHLLK